MPTFSATIDRSWLDVAPIRVGRILSGLGTPDRYLTDSSEDGRHIRVDLYRGTGYSGSIRRVTWHGRPPFSASTACCWIRGRACCSPGVASGTRPAAGASSGSPATPGSHSTPNKALQVTGGLSRGKLARVVLVPALEHRRSAAENLCHRTIITVRVAACFIASADFIITDRTMAFAVQRT